MQLYSSYVEASPFLMLSGPFGVASRGTSVIKLCNHKYWVDLCYSLFIRVTTYNVVPLVFFRYHGRVDMFYAGGLPASCLEQTHHKTRCRFCQVLPAGPPLFSHVLLIFLQLTCAQLRALTFSIFVFMYDSTGSVCDCFQRWLS